MKQLSGDLQRIPVLRILIPFVLGILTAIGWEDIVPQLNLIIPLAGILFLCRFFFLLKRRIFREFIFLFFYLAGLMSYKLSQKPVPEFEDSAKVVVLGIVHSKRVMKNGKLRFEIEAKEIVSANDSLFSRTILMAYTDDDDLVDQLITQDLGKVNIFTGTLYRLRNNGNPGEFDYAAYMARRNCYYRFYPESLSPACPVDKYQFKIKHLAAKVKERITSGWAGPEEELSILMAVALGDKSDIRPEIRENYSEAGGMHVLAVSGLHIGLIWMVLNKLLVFLAWIPGGKGSKTVLIILLLWFYAAMSGLSPSVCRSVSMFSLISFASFISRRGSSLNIVLLSALLLLIIKPQQISEIGFQLSYLAVIGIITIQPMLSGLISSRYRIVRWMIDLSSVSIAAQLATAPLSVCYFHQLPVYFLLTNLAAIPILSCIVGLFIISAPFFLTHVCEGPFNWMLIKLSALMNHCMELISSLPGSTIIGLRPGLFEILLMLLLLCSILLFTKYRVSLFAMTGTIIISGLLLLPSLKHLSNRKERKLIISHFRGGTLLSINRGNQQDHFISYKDSISGLYIRDYIESAYRERGTETRVHLLDSITEYRNESIAAIKLLKDCWVIGEDCFRILIITGSSDAYLLKEFDYFSVDIVLFHKLYYPPDLDFMSFNPGTSIVLDGSNWSGLGTAMEEKFPFLYLTDKEGAYVIFY